VLGSAGSFEARSGSASCSGLPDEVGRFNVAGSAFGGSVLGPVPAGGVGLGLGGLADVSGFAGFSGAAA
jgi:hypothetical protein